MNRTLIRCSLILIAALFAFGCTPYGRGGGGGSGDDDDGSDGVGPMLLTVTIQNSTGYDIIHFTSQVSTDDEVQAANGGGLDLPDGSFQSQTSTIDDAVYGTQFHIAAWAVDADIWCLNWEEGGRDYNAGPELTIEIEFTDDDYLDYIPDLDPAVCGTYEP